MKPLNLVFLGLSITSSWGNGHATTYRALLRGLVALGHRVTFLERDVPWYAQHRDLRELPGAAVMLYGSRAELEGACTELVRDADAVIVGSYVPEGAQVASWVLRTTRGLRLFYDIDTPITLNQLARGGPTYIDPRSIPELDAYLSFSGGQALERIVCEHGARLALPLYCSIDTEQYRPLRVPLTRSLGYLGTFSEDRQPTLERLLCAPARLLPSAQFVVAGSLYPELSWPSNLERIEHLAPAEHAAFYCSQRFALNVTRRDMIELGHSPSVRLFEAAACGVPVITDRWSGLPVFFEPGSEILVADDTRDVLRYLRKTSDEARRAIGERARARVLADHSYLSRARELERYLSCLKRGEIPALSASERAEAPRSRKAVSSHG